MHKIWFWGVVGSYWLLVGVLGSAWVCYGLGFVVDLLAILHFGGQVEENSKDLGSLVFAMSQLEVANSVLKKRHPEECSM